MKITRRLELENEILADYAKKNGLDIEIVPQSPEILINKKEAIFIRKLEIGEIGKEKEPAFELYWHKKKAKKKELEKNAGELRGKILYMDGNYELHKAIEFLKDMGEIPKKDGLEHEGMRRYENRRFAEVISDDEKNKKIIRQEGPFEVNAEQGRFVQKIVYTEGENKIYALEDVRNKQYAFEGRRAIYNDGFISQVYLFSDNFTMDEGLEYLAKREKEKKSDEWGNVNSSEMAVMEYREIVNERLIDSFSGEVRHAQSEELDLGKNMTFQAHEYVLKDGKARHALEVMTKLGGERYRNEIFHFRDGFETKNVPVFLELWKKHNIKREKEKEQKKIKEENRENEKKGARR